MAFNPGGGGGGSGTIGGAADVALDAPQANDFLRYEPSTSKWENSAVSGVAALATGGGRETVWSNYAASGNIELNLANGNVFRMTLTGNVTISFTGALNNISSSCTLIVKQDTTGGRTITWPAGVWWPGGVVPALTATAEATDILVFESITGGNTWYGSMAGQDFRSAV